MEKEEEEEEVVENLKPDLIFLMFIFILIIIQLTENE